MRRGRKPALNEAQLQEVFAARRAYGASWAKIAEFIQARHGIKISRQAIGRLSKQEGIV